MADLKISELASIPAVASADVLAIVDTSLSETNKVSIEDLLRGAPSGTAAAPSIAFVDDPDTGILKSGTNELAISTGGTQRVVVDSSGRLLIGTSSARANFYNGSNPAQVQLEGTNFQSAAFAIICNAASSDKGSLILAKNRGATVGSNTIVQDNDDLGSIEFQGSDGAQFVQAATIRASVDGTPGADDMPCRLTFLTTADGASSPSERMRIDSSGNAQVSTGQFTVGTTASTGLQFINDGTFGTIHSADLKFRTAATERLRIDSSGNVIIGGTSAVNKLDVNGGVGVSYDGGLRAYRDQQSTNDIILNHTYTGGNDQLNIAPVGDSPTSAIAFKTASGSTLSERLRIDSSGNVSIGSGVALGHKLSLGETTDSFTAIRIASTNTGIGEIRFADSDSVNPGYLKYEHTGNNLIFAANASERMRITSGGDVGIGMTSPTVKLAVSDTAAVSGFSQTSINILRSNYGGQVGGYIDQGVGHGLTFSSVNNGTATERMRINSSGNVGIATSAPRNPLEVKKGSNAIEGYPTYLSTFAANITNAVDGNDQHGLFVANRWAGSQSKVVEFGSLYGTSAAYKAYFVINGIGNVGIGTTSPAGKLAVSDGTVTGEINPYSASSTCFIGTRSNHPVSFQVNASEKVRIQTNGDLGIGTTLTRGKLDVRGNISFGPTNTTDQYQGLSFINGKDSSAALATSYIDFKNDLLVADSHIFSNHETNGSSNLVFGTTPAGSRTTDRRVERMRIAGNGVLRIGQTSSDDPSGSNISGVAIGTDYISTAASNNLTAVFGRRSSTGTLMLFRYNTTNVGSITVGTSSTSYNTSSDYRLKENVIDIADGITRVKQLQPKRFNFITDDTTTVDGFIAHEAQTVVPEAVTGTHNEVDDDDNPVYQGIDQSKLVPLLTAALQEAIAKIETLEAKVAALEAG